MSRLHQISCLISNCTEKQNACSGSKLQLLCILDTVLTRCTAKTTWHWFSWLVIGMFRNTSKSVLKLSFRFCVDGVVYVLPYSKPRMCRDRTKIVSTAIVSFHKTDLYNENRPRKNHVNETLASHYKEQT